MHPKISLPILRIAGRTFFAALMLVALCVSAFAHAGSVYVPVDSWVYPAAERLAVLTNTRSEILGMRPWTRSQFAHLLERAREMQHDAESQKLQDVLEHEFAPELNSEMESYAVESAYTRSTQIAGTPLRDSYHYGQTITNDFGRVYGQGFNNVTGESGYGQYRAGFIYARGEYQHAAALRSPSPEAITELTIHDDVTPGQIWTQGGAHVDQYRLLDSYVGVSFSRWTASLGKQSLWWGPAVGGAMSYSNNIEPIWMGRLTNDQPYHIPILGNARLDMFYGKLQGHRFEPQVWAHGEKISLQPFKNVEFGFTRTVVFLGVDYPFSLSRLWRSYFSAGNNSATYLAPNNPGSRQGGLDFSWKLPKIPMTLYTDGYCDDNPSPLASPTRSAFHPGVYIAQLPGPLARLDLRMEGSYTASENPSLPNGFNYWKEDYRDGYTNKGLLIGDPVGRAGVSWQAWSTYWIAPRDKVQVSYRNQYVSPRFLQGGGTQNDVRVTSNFVVKRNLEVELGVQAERVVIPLLTGTTAPQHDVSGWAGLKYYPEHRLQQKND